MSNGTASSAEVVTSALRENDRAVVIGAPTFGKGVGQTSISIDSTADLVVTAARWYTPTGYNIGRATPEGVYGSLAEVVDDSALQRRPRYQTKGGRWIRGGQGIVPDIVVPPVPLGPAENAFYLALGSHVDRFRAALADVAASVRQNEAPGSEDFAVTPAMRRQLYERLRALGTTLPREAFDGAGAMIDREIGCEIARGIRPTGRTPPPTAGRPVGPGRYRYPAEGTDTGGADTARHVEPGVRVHEVILLRTKTAFLVEKCSHNLVKLARVRRSL